MDERRFFFNGGIYLTRDLTENPFEVANCLAFIHNLGPGFDLLKTVFSSNATCSNDFKKK